MLSSGSNRVWISIAPYFFAILLLCISLILTTELPGGDFAQDYAGAWVRWHRVDLMHPPVGVNFYCCIEKLPGQLLHQVLYQTGKPIFDSSAPLIQSAHPPFTIAMTLPFAFFSWELARYLWLFVGWLSIITSWRKLSTTLAARALFIPFWSFALAMGAFEPVIFLLLALSIYFRDQRGAVAGVLLGCAVALKIYPAIIIIGFWYSGYRRVATIASISVIIFVSIGELLMGLGATFAWLTYVPINTELFVDQVQNLSVTHWVRFLFGPVPSLLVSILVLVLFSLPIAFYVSRSRRWSSSIVLTLLTAPLCWGSYLPLLSLAEVNIFALVLFAVAGSINILITMSVFSNVPSVLIILLVVLPTVALIFTWYKHIRP